MRRRRPPFEVFLLAGGILLAAMVAWSTPATGDYWPGGKVIGDSNAAPAIDALAHGHIGAYLANQPLMGLVSILLRVPAAMVAHARPGHPLLEYRLGVVLCLCSAPLLSAWLSRLSPGREWKAICLLACVLLIAGPGKIDAVRAGHPEEALTAVLAVSAVIAAQRQRQWWAGVILGLAIGTKPWAVLAAVPVLMTLRRGRWQAVAAAALVGGFAEIGAIADPSSFLARARGLGSIHLVSPYSLWWQLGANMPATPLPSRTLPLGLSRSSSLFLVTGLAVAAAIGWARKPKASQLSHPLALLAALWLVRALADPHPNDYYYVPFLIATAVWEVYSLRRPPVLAVVAATLLSVTYYLPFDDPSWPNSFLLGWSVLIGVYLARSAFVGTRAWPRLSTARSVISTQ